jgi:hypothetical protein
VHEKAIQLLLEKTARVKTTTHVPPVATMSKTKDSKKVNKEEKIDLEKVRVT